MHYWRPRGEKIYQSKVVGVFLCLCQSLYLGVRLKLRCNVSAYILPIGLFLTTVNVLGTCSQTTGNNRPHPSLRVLSLCFVRLTPRHTNYFYAVKQGRKHAAKRKEKVYNTPLALMTTLFHLWGVDGTQWYFISSTACPPHKWPVVRYFFSFFLFVRHSVGLW